MSDVGKQLDTCSTGFTSVGVFAIEAELCSWCQYDNINAPVTHTAVVTHWVGAYGSASNFKACEFHANAIADELRRRVKK